MNKIQKIWMWIFVAMFAIPEILWSPITNFYYEFFQSSKTSYVQPLRNNFLQVSDNSSYLKFVMFLQFLGLLLLFIFLVRNKSINNKITKYLLGAFLAFLLIIVGFALFFALSFSIEIL